MTEPLEDEIDALYRLPPGELVDARNALTERLKKAGDKAGAARVKALKKPTPAAWALNQVHHRHHALLVRAREQSVQLQQLHAEGGLDRKQMAAAVEAQRAALQAAVDAAMRCCEAVGVQAGPAQQRKVYTSLQAWLAGAGDEPPGRMTHDIEPSGFGAMNPLGEAKVPELRPAPAGGNVGLEDASATTAHARATRATSSTGTSSAGVVASPKTANAASVVNTPSPLPSGPDPRAIQHAEKVLAEREQRVREARLRAMDRASARDEVRRALDRALAAVAEAERTLEEAKARVATRTAELERAEQSANAAAGDHDHAVENATKARAELTKLKGAGSD